MINESPLLTPAEAAAYLRRSERTLANWRHRHRGEGPRYLRVNGRVQYRQADLDEYLEAQVTESRRDEAKQMVLRAAFR